MSYWTQLVRANPKLREGGKVTFTVEEFRRIVTRAETHGRRSAEKAPREEGLVDRLFNGLFGK